MCSLPVLFLANTLKPKYRIYMLLLLLNVLKKDCLMSKGYSVHGDNSRIYKEYGKQYQCDTQYEYHCISDVNCDFIHHFSSLKFDANSSSEN